MYAYYTQTRGESCVVETITPGAENCVTTEHAAGLAKDQDLTLCHLKLQR